MSKIKINKYKLKENTTIQAILDNGFQYSTDCRYLTKFNTLKDSIIIHIAIPLANIYSFDFYDNIDVLDDDFCQPYMPFYDNYTKEVENNNFLIKVIKRYNEVMDNINIFEKR